MPLIPIEVPDDSSCIPGPWSVTRPVGTVLLREVGQLSWLAGSEEVYRGGLDDAARIAEAYREYASRAYGVKLEDVLDLIHVTVSEGNEYSVVVSKDVEIWSDNCNRFERMDIVILITVPKKIPQSDKEVLEDVGDIITPEPASSGGPGGPEKPRIIPILVEGEPSIPDPFGKAPKVKLHTVKVATYVPIVVVRGVITYDFVTGDIRGKDVPPIAYKDTATYNTLPFNDVRDTVAIDRLVRWTVRRGSTGSYPIDSSFVAGNVYTVGSPALSDGGYYLPIYTEVETAVSYDPVAEAAEVQQYLNEGMTLNQAQMEARR